MNVLSNRAALHRAFTKFCPGGAIPPNYLGSVLKHLGGVWFDDLKIESIVKDLKAPEENAIQIDVLLAWLFTHKMCAIDAVQLGRAPEDSDHGGYDWIRKANAEPDREARRGVSALTQRAVDCRGYMLGETKTVRLEHVEELLAGTCLVSPTLGTWPDILAGNGCLPLPEWELSTKLVVERGVILDVAVARRKLGKRVAAVNAASAYHCGGGFATGGRHALEEAICEQTTLYGSLQKAAGLSEAAQVTAPAWARPPNRRDGSEWEAHIPHEGVVLSPFIEVFRGGTNQGYPFEDEVTVLEGIVSVAMPNCNDRMSDSPVDAHSDPTEYETQLEQKWRAALTAAAFYTKADCLVLPDAGCGVFRNPPAKVGAVLGRLLGADFYGRFDEVCLAFPGGPAGAEFAASVETAFVGQRRRYQ